MKLYKTTITPVSNFSTPLKGDTLFGQICWSVRYSFGKERLEELLENYEISPFLIVSDGFASGYLPKPNMPSKLLGEDKLDKKISRKNIWLTFEELQKGSYRQARSDKDISNRQRKISVLRNSIDYKNFTTGNSTFAPYDSEEISLSSQDIYLLVDENKLSLKDLETAFEVFAQNGYGKDTTIGKGRFKFEKFKEFHTNNNSKRYMALSPFSPKNLKCKNLYYEPFSRFGKFGADRAFKNAFKKPILMANSTSVVEFENLQNIRYIGSCIKGISKLYTDTVHQGYSIVIPIGELS